MLERVGAKFVECLSCGQTRRTGDEPLRLLQTDECPRCGYVGWAETESLTEALRRTLRETTVERRGIAIVW
jgi:hypothetical protein